MCFAVDPFFLRASPAERLFGMCNHRYARQLSNIEARERILSPVRANPWWQCWHSVQQLMDICIHEHRTSHISNSLPWNPPKITVNNLNVCEQISTKFTGQKWLKCFPSSSLTQAKTCWTSRQCCCAAYPLSVCVFSSPQSGF